MRCLFVVDQVARFREVAIALDSHDVAMTLVKDFKLADRLETNGSFDVMIAGVNALASDSMRFLQRRRVRRCPVFAVTCEPELQRALVESGADRIVVLPDDADRLQLALAMLFGPAGDRTEETQFSRFRQHLARRGNGIAAGWRRQP